MQAVDRFLSACVRSALHDAPWPEWPGRLAHSRLAETTTPPADDDALTTDLLERIEFHGIASLLIDRKDALVGWPGRLTDDIRQIARWRAVRDTLARKCVGQLVDRLADEGIPCLLLKGDAVAYGFYDNPALRPRGDSDLLIAPENLEAVRAILLQLGWVRTPAVGILPAQEDWVFQPGSAAPHALDLHWHLTSRPTLSRALPVAFLWSHCQPLPRFSRCAQAPGPIALLLHGALNQALHEHRGYHGMEGPRLIAGRRLIWSCDYWRICRNFSSNDWQELSLFAAKHDMGAIVHAALTGAVEDIGLVVPSETMASLLPENGISPTLDYIKQRQILRELKADWQAADTLTSWLILLVNHGVQTRAALLKKYPDAIGWPTVALQLRRYFEAIFLRGRDPGDSRTEERLPGA